MAVQCNINDGTLYMLDANKYCTFKKKKNGLKIFFLPEIQQTEPLVHGLTISLFVT